MKALELFQEGKPDEAIQAGLEAVRNNPTSVPARSSLCELLCFAGDLERADKQLDALAQIDPDAMVGVSMFRHLLRAEQARFDFFQEGRVPEFITKPDDEIQARLAAHIAIREGDADEARARLAEAEQLRQPISGVCDDTPFDDFRDLDDLLGSVLEVLTSNGKYYWVPLNLVRQISFDEVEFARDLLWRPMEIEVEGDIDGRVYAPAIYFGTSAAADPKVRVGQATDWAEDIPGIVRGVGQKMFLCGDDARPFVEIHAVRMDEA